MLNNRKILCSIVLRKKIIFIISPQKRKTFWYKNIVEKVRVSITGGCMVFGSKIQQCILIFLEIDLTMVYQLKHVVQNLELYHFTIN